MDKQKEEKVDFVVIDENLFGYINSRWPLWVQILSTSHIRGSVHSWKDGFIPVPPRGIGMRPATRKDFHDFKVSPKGYDSNERYNFPKE